MNRVCAVKMLKWSRQKQKLIIRTRYFNVTDLETLLELLLRVVFWQYYKQMFSQKQHVHIINLHEAKYKHLNRSLRLLDFKKGSLEITRAHEGGY